MRYCPTCQATFDGEEVFCPHDGTRLVAEKAYQPGRLAGTSLAQAVNLEAFLFADHLGERYRGRLLSDNREVRVVVFHRGFDVGRHAIVSDQLAKLTSPLPHQILELHSLHLDSEPNFLIEEQPQRESLAHLLKKKGALPWKQALHLTIRLARILEWLAEQGVPHRAIHPHSIYVDNPLSSSIQIGELAVGLLTFPLPTLEADTPRDAIPVYPGFIAPEWLDDDRDGDLSQCATYTIGSVLMTALGFPLFDDDELEGLNLKKWSTDPQRDPIDLSDLLDAPDLLQDLANMLVAPMPEKRFQTPAAAMAALANLLDSSPDEVAPPLGPRKSSAFLEDDRPITGPVPFPDAEDSSPEDDEPKSIAKTQLGFTPKNARADKKTHVGLPAQAFTGDFDDDEEEPLSPAPRVIIDDPGDVADSDRSDRSTARFTLEDMSGDEKSKAEEEVAEEAQEDSESEDSHKSTLMMGAISVADIAAEAMKADADDEPDTDDQPDTDDEPDADDQPDQVPEGATQKHHAVEIPEQNDEESVISGESESSSSSPGTTDSDDDGPSIIVDSHEPEPSIIVNDNLEDDADDDSAEDQSAEEQSEEEEEEPKKPATSDKVNIGFVEARQSGGGEEFSDDWFSRSTEDAWDDTLVKEAYEKSRWAEKAFRIGLIVGLAIFVVGAFIFTQTYDPEIEEEEEELIEEEYAKEPSINIERTLDQFDYALTRGEILQPLQRSAMTALRDLQRYADEDVYEDARERFVAAADAAGREAEENGDLALARNYSGRASQYAPDDQELRMRAEDIQARYVAEIEGNGAPQDQPDAGTDADTDIAADDETEVATGQTSPSPTPRPATRPSPRTNPSEIYQEAESARRANDFERARRLYLEFLEHNPNHASANAHLARIYFDEADHRTAIRYQLRAVEAAPNNVNHRLQLGMLHYRLDQYSEAITVWERVLELDPENTDAQRWIGLAERSMN